jgi:hypothetical protein
MVMVRAEISTAVISASMATPALFVHFRISAREMTGRFRTMENAR